MASRRQAAIEKASAEPAPAPVKLSVGQAYARAMQDPVEKARRQAVAKAELEELRAADAARREASRESYPLDLGRDVAAAIDPVSGEAWGALYERGQELIADLQDALIRLNGLLATLPSVRGSKGRGRGLATTMAIDVRNEMREAGAPEALIRRVVRGLVIRAGTQNGNRPLPDTVDKKVSRIMKQNRTKGT